MMPLDAIKTLGDALQFARKALGEAKSFEAALLLGMVTGHDRLYLLTHPDAVLSEEDAKCFMGLLNRRLAHEPLQHLRGKTEFMGLCFIVSPDVLIPRPDTEILVETAIELFKDRPVRLADMGTGSGAISVSLAHYLPEAKIVATDISEAALDIARENAQGYSIEFRLGESLSPLDGLFDGILSNPPYIPTQEVLELEPEVRDYEPRLALDGGPEGLIYYRLLANEAFEYLKPDGWLLMEVGAGQAPDVCALLAAKAWRDIQTRQDLAGIERVVLARRPQ